MACALPLLSLLSLLPLLLLLLLHCSAAAAAAAATATTRNKEITTRAPVPLAPSIEIAPSVLMPLVAFGTGECQGAACVATVQAAIGLGYRAIDTANQYGNQKEISTAVRNALRNPALNLTRSDLFVISKVEGGLTGAQTAARLLQDARQLNISGGPIDLILLHYPKAAPDQTLNGTVAEQWAAISAFKRAGGCRAVGVSQFSQATLEMLQAEIPSGMAVAASGGMERPVVDQIGWHAGQGGDPQSLASAARARGDMHLMAFSPLAEASPQLLNSSLLKGIAARHQVSAAQVALRWLVQRGTPVAVAASSADYQEQNLDLFFFNLSKDEMQAIDGMTAPPGCPYWPGSATWLASTCYGRLHNCCTVNPAYCPPTLPPCLPSNVSSLPSSMQGGVGEAVWGKH